MKKCLSFVILTIMIFSSGCASNNAPAQVNVQVSGSAAGVTPAATASTQINQTTKPEQAAPGNTQNSANSSNQTQTITLWTEGNMPSSTEYTENNSNYFDDPDFRPNMVYVPVKEGVAIKGAVLLCAGGAFQFRGNEGDCFPTAEQLSALGYQCFVVNYRLRPYTQEEGALDLARAVRYVRNNAQEYGIDESDIAVVGYSAGGILCGELLLNFDGLVNGTALDVNYVPDELDKVSADASAVAMVYSFYGRLSVASLDVEKFKVSDLPPTYFLYGSREVFRSQIEACADAAQQAGVSVETKILDGYQHGFGGRGNWTPDFDKWLSAVFEK